MNGEVVTKLSRYITDELLVKRGVEVTDGTPLMDGLIDSLGIQRLVAFIEEEFDVMLDHSDMIPENFTTVRALEGLVQRKLGGAAASESATG